jgi:hypothetical protein
VRAIGSVLVALSVHEARCLVVAIDDTLAKGEEPMMGPPLKAIRADLIEGLASATRGDLTAGQQEA